MKLFIDSINKEFVVFLAGVYGERACAYIHKLICTMSPELFTFVGVLGMAYLLFGVKK